MIEQYKFALPKDDVDIDYVYEPYIRAKVLLKVLNHYSQSKYFETKEQNECEAETFYIIHPVLKHLAINKVKENRSNEGSNLYAKS